MAAARFIKEARWLVPYVPTDLPPNVERVLGIARMRHGDVVNSVAFSPDGTRLATASRTRPSRSGTSATAASSAPTADRRTPSGGRLVARRTLDRLHRRQRNPHLGPGERQAEDVAEGARETGHAPLRSARTATVWRRAADDFSVRIWDIDEAPRSSHLNSELDKQSKAQVYAVAYSPNGKLVAAVNGNGQLQSGTRALEAEEATGHRASTPTRARTAYQVAFGKDTSVIFTWGSDNKAKQWVGLGPDGENMPGTAGRRRSKGTRTT